MKIKIRENIIKYRLPWYVKCSTCGNIMCDSSPVVKKVQEEGWMYDTEKDIVYCPNCKNNSENVEDFKKDIIGWFKAGVLDYVTYMKTHRPEFLEIE